MDNLEQALPPGATPKDVADDIPAKVSEGEYIIPANVVRYIGASKLEKMVAKALEELQGMEEKGRMGNMEEVEEEEDDDVLEFATGGLVPTQNTAQAGFTGFEQYTGPNGQRISVPVKNGTPVIPLPQGFTKTPPQSPQPTAPIEQETGRSGGTTETLTGASKAVKDWTPDDYMQMAQGSTTSAGRVGGKAVGAMMSAVPMGGLINKAANNKVDVAREQLLKMVESGVSPSGVKIPDEDMAKLRQAKEMIDNPEKAGVDEKLASGFMKGVSGGKGVFGTAVEAAKGTVDNPLDKALNGIKDAINDAIKGAIDTTYGQKVAEAKAESTTTEEDKEKDEAKDKASESSLNSLY